MKSKWIVCISGQYSNFFCIVESADDTELRAILFELKLRVFPSCPEAGAHASRLPDGDMDLPRFDRHNANKALEEPDIEFSKRRSST